MVYTFGFIQKLYYCSYCQLVFHRRLTIYSCHVTLNTKGILTVDYNKNYCDFVLEHIKNALEKDFII